MICFKFQNFAADCSDATDFVEIFDGNSTSNKLLVRLCGFRKLSDIRSSSNTMFIRMKTEEENHRGFYLDFKGIVSFTLHIIRKN